MEDQNNLNFENTESVNGESIEPTAKKPIPKLPIIIGAAVAGVAAIVVLLILLLGGKKNFDGDIAFKEDAMPQSVFVLGQELDLSSTVLLVDDNGKVSEVALNSEDVVVSGYNKDILGEQTLVITYKDKTLEFKVNVVERMQVVDYTTDYLVGSDLDLNAGRVKITRDDGTNYTVVLKSSKVKVEGFSSKTAGQKDLTVTYSSGSENYTASYSVNVHNVENIALTSTPTKASYNSHDEGVSTDGGIITLSALNGKVKKEVPVTADMIRGFDLSAANDENPVVTQIVNVEYDGKLHPYEIVIKYTSVSKFKDNADVATGFTWKGNDVPEISDERGRKAVEMMELYLSMSPADQTRLSREEVLNMARTAMIYAYMTWGEDINEFDGAFELEEMQFVLTCETREAVESAIEKLKDKTRPIYTYYSVISGMIEVFGTENNDTVLFTFTDPDGKKEDVDMYFSEYPTVDPEFFDLLEEVFAYMLELDTLMDKVGDDWLTNTVAYSDEIEAVFDKIVNSDFYSNEFSQFFYYVSAWRPNDDAFDFLYYYYYDVKVFDENDDDADSSARVSHIIQIANIRLPSELEEIFANVYEAMNQIDYLANYMVTDTTQFFYHYFKACELSKELLSRDSENDSHAAMLKILYFGLPLNSMLGMDASEEIYTFDYMISYLTSTEGGYYTLCGALIDLPEFDALMDKYLEIICKIFEEDENANPKYQDTAEYLDDVKAMLALYMELTPAQQFSFLGTLNAFYAMNIPPLAFDTAEEYAELTALFVDMINEAYLDMFQTQDGKDAYLALILATELYAQRFTTTDWLDGSYTQNNLTGEEVFTDGFRTKMNKVAAALEALRTASSPDYDTFMTNLGYIYDQYKQILDRYNNTDDGDGDGNEPANPEDNLELGDWADEFAALKSAVSNLEASYSVIQAGRYVYDLFFSCYERAQKIYNGLLENPEVPENIKYILIHEGLYVNDVYDETTGEPTGEKIYWSYDYVISVYRSIYINALLNLGAYDLYEQYNLAELMNLIYDIYWVKDMNKTLEAMRKFYKLDVEAQVIFILYFSTDSEYNYYTAIESALVDAEYSEAVQTAVVRLLNVEMNAIIYNFYKTLAGDEEMSDELKAEIEDVIADLNDAYDSFEEAYNAIVEEADVAAFANFNEFYLYYKDLVESTNTNSDSGNGDA